MIKEENIYQILQEAVDGLSFGFPKTPSGVEIEILKYLFTEEEASIYLCMGAIPEPAEVIAQRMGEN